MMNIIRLGKEKRYAGNLLLVNGNFPLPLSSQNELWPVDTRYPDILMRREAVNALQLVLQKIGCKDEIVPVSGYRSAVEQTRIYENSLKENGKEFTKKFVALPQHSEHQTGLAIDLGLKKEEIDFICPEFPYEGICNEFRKTALQYGFIERYPKGKERITGIGHEPWHFRYVGHPHSEIIGKHGFVLEEYMDYMKQFPYNEKHLRIKSCSGDWEIFYLPADETGETTVTIPSDVIYLVSGNNVDGFIITIWRNKSE